MSQISGTATVKEIIPSKNEKRNRIRVFSSLQENVPISNLLNTKTHFMSGLRSALNEVTK